MYNTLPRQPEPSKSADKFPKNKTAKQKPVECTSTRDIGSKAPSDKPTP